MGADQSFVGIFAQYGLPGLVILFMGWGAYKAIKILFNKYVDATDRLIAFGPQALDLIHTNTLSQDSNTVAIKVLSELIRAQQERAK